jgi:hypothetical protein
LQQTNRRSAKLTRGHSRWWKPKSTTDQHWKKKKKEEKRIILKPRSQSNQEAKENKKRTSHDSRPRLSRITETYSRAAKLVC